MAKAKPWKRLSSRRLFNHKLIKINEDVVMLPNGKLSRQILEAPSKLGSVIMIVVNEKGKVLVQREYSYPPNTVMWQLPGGRMKKNETIKQAALRELSEETGLSAKKVSILAYYYGNNRRSNRKQHVLLCEELFESNLTADDDEFIEIYWISAHRLHDMVKAGEFNNINLLAALNIWFHQGN